MRACILAAGIGQRLRPLTDDKPKALVEVAGMSFLDRLVTQLVAVGVTELVVATGFREDAVVAALARCPIPWLVRRNDAYDKTQNSVSLHACADALLAGGAQDTFKLDGDVVLDIEALRRLIEKLRESQCDLVAAVDARDDLGAEEMKVTLEGGLASGSDRISAFGKHLDPRTSVGESIGVELIAAKALSPFVDALGALVTSGTTNLYYEDVYDRLLPGRGAARTLDTRAVMVGDLPWTEVDTAADLARAATIALKTRLS